MGYLQSWLYYNSGNEAPERFWRWAGLTLLGHLAGRKIWYTHGKWKIYPFIYTGLIGDAGSGKSSAKSEVKNVMVTEFPSYLQSNSIQSREDIVVKMGSPECERLWKNPARTDGQLESFRPYFIIANEFQNFLSVDTVNMVAFLTDIFDEDHFSTGFKNTKSDTFINPLVSILACGTPGWLMSELKINLFAGGLGRRLILVCDESGEPVPDPFQPDDFQVYKKDCIEHLRAVEALQGEFFRTDEAKEWWHAWYIPHKKSKPDDPILLQFHSTKHVMVLKVAMLLALNERPFKLVLERVHLETALAFFDDLIPAIQRLTSGIGRNELAGVGAQVMEFITGVGGTVPWNRLRVNFRRYLQTPEFQEVIDDFLKTEQLYIMELPGEVPGIMVRFVMTPERTYETLAPLVKKGTLPELWKRPWEVLRNVYGRAT